MEEKITMPPKDESNLSESFRIFLDEKEVTSSNPFGIKVSEEVDETGKKNDRCFEFKEISKEQQEKDRISSYDYLI